MAYCIRCGAKMFTGAQYCYFCGQTSPFAEQPFPVLLQAPENRSAESPVPQEPEEPVAKIIYAGHPEMPMYTERQTPHPVQMPPTVSGETYAASERMAFRPQEHPETVSPAAVPPVRIMRTPAPSWDGYDQERTKKRNTIILCCTAFLMAALIGVIGWLAYRNGWFEGLFEEETEEYVYSPAYYDVFPEESEAPGNSDSFIFADEEDETAAEVSGHVPEIKKTRLYGEQGISVTALRLDVTDPYEPVLELMLTNDTGEDLTFSCETAYINGKITDSLLFVDVLSGETVSDALSLYGFDPENEEMREIGEIGFDLYLLDMSGERTSPEIPTLKIRTNLGEGKSYIYDPVPDPYFSEEEEWNDEGWIGEEWEEDPVQEEFYDPSYTDADESLWYDDGTDDGWAPFGEGYGEEYTEDYDEYYEDPFEGEEFVFT